MLFIFEWASVPWTFNWSILKHKAVCFGMRVLDGQGLPLCACACGVFVSHWAICYALDLTMWHHSSTRPVILAEMLASQPHGCGELHSMGPHHPSACGDGWSWADFQNQEAQGAKCLLHQKRTQVFVWTFFWSQMIAESMGRGGLGPVPLEADLETTGAQYSSKTCDEIRRLYLTSVAFGPSFLRELSYQSAKSPEEMVQVMLYCPA